MHTLIPQNFVRYIVMITKDGRRGGRERECECDCLIKRTWSEEEEKDGRREVEQRKRAGVQMMRR